MFDQSPWLEIRAREEDVERYLDGQMSQLPQYVLRNQGLQDDIKSQIIKAVDGMFLLARLHLDSLRGKKSPKAIRQALEKLPTGSDAYDFAYKDVMERIESQLPDKTDLAKQVLSWITCAKRPLKAIELQEAIAVEVNESKLDKENLSDIVYMVSICAGLVNFDEESNIIRLVHYTTQEYFEQTKGDWFPDAQTYITTICFTYLSLNVFEDRFCKTTKDFKGRLRSNQFFEYAATNWEHHAHKASILNQPLSQAAVKFFKSEAKVNASWQMLKLSKRFSWTGPSSSKRMFMVTAGIHLIAYFGVEGILKLLLDTGGFEIDLKRTMPEILDDDSFDSERTPLSYAVENGHKT
ncbi:hypothetical protein DSL72_000813 [Monilinia vaccinii-corymbosi]|uniref:GPI inositol-deacylase winged helix domain-containing protein n=1 Tax=Monilinia vaccinii-corymbosi TaxID=61207 RepID=A0A8A3P3N8_9HELO|nr:hypothetical protein DSL72_000813 [Monilinia vaccinii-corymbosi]